MQRDPLATTQPNLFCPAQDKMFAMKKISFVET